MHVLFTMDSLEIGGTELNALRTAGQLVAAGHRVTLGHMSPRGSLLKEFELLGVDLLAIPVFGLASRSAARAAADLFFWLYRNKPDVLHAQDVYANILSVPVARAALVPRAIASRRWVSELARPSLATANRISCSLAHRITANSPSAVRAASDELGSLSDRVCFVPNFVDVRSVSISEARAARSELATLGVNIDAPILGCVAQLRAVKRHDVLLRAFAQVSSSIDVSLVLVGDGPERDILLGLVAELGIAHRVFFRGAVRSSANLHSGLDISLLLSDCEASPNSLLEAAAAGVPIVATRVGGIADLFEHEQTALLAHAADPDSAAQQITRLLTDDRLRQHIAQNARELALGFTPTRTLDALMNCYSLDGACDRQTESAPAATSLLSSL